MFDYDVERLKEVLRVIVHSAISPDAWLWLGSRLSQTQLPEIYASFSIMPRKIGKALVRSEGETRKLIEEIKPGFSISAWPSERLCRVFFLMHLPAKSREEYVKTIESLFRGAEMAELAALYAALPILAYPESWKMRCAEGVRSNIATVLESLMYRNPYPATYLDESAWNQLVLKAFFTDKDILQIYGLDERANAELALVLSDYAHERWAAGRSVNPLLWRLTANFISPRINADLQRVLKDGTTSERRAAALAVYQSGSNEAIEMLSSYPKLKEEAKNGRYSWETLDN